MLWSPGLHMGRRRREGGVGSGRRGVGGWWSKTPAIGEGPNVCRIFHLERFVFSSWLIGAFD